MSTGQQSPRPRRRLVRGSTAVASGSARAARATFSRVRQATHAEGAGESGLSRLIELHAFNAAGDAALTVSLAGTLFFQVPTGEARGQVALFLGLTVLPFAVVAPLIGPFLDRFRRGRRWAIGSTMAIRGFLCWVLADAVASGSAAIFPAALGCLVASKAYGVTRAAAVPRLIPAGLGLVKANARISLAGIAGAAVSAPLATAASLLGSQWSLRFAFVVFVGATILAVLLPSRVDSSAGEEQVGLAQAAGTSQRRRVDIRALVVTGLRCNAGLRALSGFLTMFMAFLLRDQPFPGWEHRTELLLGLVIGAAGLGSTLGTTVGALLRTRKPEVVVLVTLVVDAAMAVVAALFFGLVTAVALGLVAGLCQQLGKLSLDALIQRETAEAVRTSVFARSETLLQLSWVLGGFAGVFMPLIPRLGLGLTAVVLLAWLLVVLRGAKSLRRQERARRAPQPA